MKYSTITDHAEAAAAPVLSAASTLSEEAADLASSVADSVSRAELASHASGALPALWRLIREHPAIAALVAITAAGGVAWLGRRSGDSDSQPAETGSTTRQPVGAGG